jgi:hypothetical protein
MRIDDQFGSAFLTELATADLCRAGAKQANARICDVQQSAAEIAE